MSDSGPSDPGGERPPAAAAPPTVEIKVRDDGPYKVTGPVRLVDPEGGEWTLPPGESVALCRCGRSENRPFCDGSHRETGFASTARAGAGAGGAGGPAERRS